MPKPSIGCDAASKRTALIPSRILYSPLHWRYSAPWMRRGPLQRQHLHLIQALPSAATETVHRAITQPTSPDASAFMRAYEWPGCLRRAALQHTIPLEGLRYLVMVVDMASVAP